MAVMVVAMLVMALPLTRYHSVPLAGTTSSLLLDLAALTLPTPVLLVPCAQRLAAEHEVVVVDDGGNHPVSGAS